MLYAALFGILLFLLGGLLDNNADPDLAMTVTVVGFFMTIGFFIAWMIP
jgi:hypothetical protein